MAMEDLFLSVSLAFLFVVVSIFVLFKHQSKSDGRNVKLPPGSFGWPIVGETIQFLSGRPEDFVSDRVKKYSPDIFKTKILGEKTVVICGPKGNKFLFSNQEKLFAVFRPHPAQKLFRSYRTDESSNSLVPIVRTEIRTPGFFKPAALKRYLAKMDSIVDQTLEFQFQGKNEVLKFHPISKTLALTIACHFFLGIENPDRIARLVGHFDDVTLGIHSMILNFPGTTFYRASKGAIKIRKELLAVIKEKKAAMASGAPMQDILTHMVMAIKNTPDSEIADKMMGLLVAGYSTVSTTITFFMKFVGQSNEIYDKVLSEQLGVRMAKKVGEGLEWDDLSKMNYTWNVICEVMRLVPPLQGTFREALTDFTYAGYTIPKGWKVYWSVSTTNKSSNYFTEPENFDPSRYEGAEGPAPYTYMPFGGGPTLCPGKDYTRLAVLTFVRNMVNKFKWEVLVPNERVLGNMMPTPEKDLPIRLFRH